MGYKRTTHHVETDAATVAFVRILNRQLRTYDHEVANRRECEDGGAIEREAADTVRRFINRIVEAASDDVREQLKSEGTWI